MKNTWLVILLLTTACTTFSGHREENLEYSLKSIQSAVANQIRGGLERVSENRREFISKYFLPSDLDKSYKEVARLYRAQAHVYVLGDRRPYDLVIQVTVEGRLANRKEIKSIYAHRDLKKGSWDDGERDDRLAKRIAQDILDSLKKTQRDRNLIDDFRVF